jgi:hypothetical protein
LASSRKFCEAFRFGTFFFSKTRPKMVVMRFLQPQRGMRQLRAVSVCDENNCDSIPFSIRSWTCTDFELMEQLSLRPTILAATATPFQRRNLHNVPPLPHGEAMNEAGIPGLLSPQAYDLAWTKYQQHLVNRVNELTAGKSEGGMRFKVQMSDLH